MEIGIVSDTHMPRGARRLPDACVERLAAADLIIHAGDLVTLEVLDQLRALGTVVAVSGNVDDAQVRAELPVTATVQAGNCTLAVTHDGGPAKDRLSRLRTHFPGADAVIFGHSHIPLHARDQDGFQIFNPGSPTERRRSPFHTMGVARASRGGLTFELIVLD